MFTKQYNILLISLLCWQNSSGGDVDNALNYQSKIRRFDPPRVLVFLNQYPVQYDVSVDGT